MTHNSLYGNYRQTLAIMWTLKFFVIYIPLKLNQEKQNNRFQNIQMTTFRRKKISAESFNSNNIVQKFINYIGSSHQLPSVPLFTFCVQSSIS